MSARRPAVGRGACDCSNISIMQLFHELKQQFPAVPDEVVNACINDNCHDRPACRAHLQREAETLPRTLAYPPSLMGAPPTRSGPSIDHRTNADGSDHVTRMTETSVHRLDTNINEHVKPSAFSTHPRRTIVHPSSSSVIGVVSPTRTSNDVPPPPPPPLPSPQPSNPVESPTDRAAAAAVAAPRPSALFHESAGKPPISPSSNKRFGAKVSPLKPKTFDAKIKKLPEESKSDNQLNYNPKPPINATSVSPSDKTNLGAIKKSPAKRPASLDLPKQTANASPVGGSVNLSVNVNCSVDLVSTPTSTRRHSTVLEVTPEPVWCHQDLKSPRSYTSVNLTLRTPTSEPQPPIDICSANSSLTYTTSSFDSRQGLQSRLQITVGPGGVGSVTAVRTRPRSSYHPDGAPLDPTPVRAGSMPDLATTTTTSSTTNLVVLVSRQLERKEQLKNELEAGRERLSAIKKEVQALRLENTPEYRDRLKKEIKHLQSQCERLTQEVDRHSESRVPLGETNEEFYRHIYTGQRGSLRSRSSRRNTRPQQQTVNEADEPRWPCHICTFRNHPLMDKCEQCEMPRILLVSAGPGENIHIRFSPGNTTRVIHSWVV